MSIRFEFYVASKLEVCFSGSLALVFRVADRSTRRDPIARTSQRMHRDIGESSVGPLVTKVARAFCVTRKCIVRAHQ